MKVFQYLKTLFWKKDRGIEDYSSKEIVELVVKWLDKGNGNRHIVMSVSEDGKCHSLMSKNGNAISAMVYSMLKSEMGDFFFDCLNQAVSKYVADYPQLTIPFKGGKYKS